MLKTRNLSYSYLKQQSANKLDVVNLTAIVIKFTSLWTERDNISIKINTNRDAELFPVRFNILHIKELERRQLS